MLALAAGMQLDLDVLLSEIEMTEVEPERLAIDPNATLIDDQDVETEKSLLLGERIGSTLTGTGAALARKVMRIRDVRRAGDVEALSPYIADVSTRLHELIASNAHVIVEGTQGLGLSLHHGTYPYVTARDTTAAAFLSEAGLPPTLVDDVVVVLRTFPIRVGGPSGPLPGETTWEDIRVRAGYPEALAEYTTVTGRLRRVAGFDWDLAERAVRLNGATAIAVHGLDYINHDDLGCRSRERLSRCSRQFVEDLEGRLNVPVRWLYTGPGGDDIVDWGSESRAPRSEVTQSRSA
jgi:adenylosuccinate synthase